MLKRVLTFIISISLSATVCSASLNGYADAEEASAEVQSEATDTASADGNNYNGPFVSVGEAVLPMPEHMPGTFFTKNGKACYCHNTADCISSGSGCNCMRFYPTGNAEDCEIDLLATQCFGFSRLVFYKCFGFVDASINSSKYHSVGSLSRGSVTEASVKALLSKAAPGAHIRLAKGHSVSVLSMSDSSIIIYHANAGGDNVEQQDCVVSTRAFTWAEFAEYAALGINYVNMPNEYPGYSDTDAPEIVYPEPGEYTVGKYQLTDNLNLRVEPNTNCNIILTIPSGTVVEVTEINGDWGKTVYEGNEGWIALWYTVCCDENNGQDEITDENPENPFVLGEDGYLRGIVSGLSCEDFSALFGGDIEITDMFGEDVTSGIIKTGHTVKFSDGSSAVICLAGDVNLDGMVDADDYMLAKRAFFGTSSPNEAAKEACDTSGAEGIDAEDYIALKRYYFSNDSALFSQFLNK